MKKRIGLSCLGVVLLLVMVLVLLPSLQTRVDAAVPNSITINGITVPSGKYLPTGATYVVDSEPVGGYFYYYNGVLTMEDAYYTTRSGRDIIYADGDLTVKLVHGNRISVDSSTSYGYGIKTTGKLTFTGSGTLEINTILDNGIEASGDIDFSQTGTVTVNSTKSTAINCDNNIVVNGNVIATSNVGYALYANNSITINKGDVNANATHPSYAAIYTRTGAVYVYGGTTNVDADGNGIYPYASSYLQYGGTVNITADYVGIKVTNTASTAAVYGGNLTVTSAQDGIVAPSFKIQAGRATIKSQNVKQDADYYALKLGGNSSSYLQCASHIKTTAATEIGGTMSSLSYANLPNYDHVSLVAAIKVNGVEVENGRYLASNGNSTSVSAPSSTTGYAYYKDNVLTLNNYTGSNTGTYGIYSLGDLTIQQVQSSVNSLTTGSSYHGIRVHGNLTIQGLGQLKIYGGQRAVYATGTLKVSYSQLFCYGCGIYSAGNMTLSYPIISVSQFGTAAAGTYAIESAGNISVTDGVIDVNCPDYANGQYVRGIVGKNITISGTASLELDTIGMGISGSSNITISGGNVKVNAVNGSGVYASGTLSISGGTVNVTAHNDALRGNKVTVTGGQITAISTNTSADADNRAVSVYSNSSTYFSVASTISVIGNKDTSSAGAAPFAISSLSDYDYIRIGSFVMLHDVELPSGYYMESGNSVKTVSQTAPSSGKYAYYYNGVLTLNNYSYSGSSVGIRTYADTRINLVGGSEVNHIISHAGNLVFVGSALHLKANLGTAAISTNGDVFIDGGRITVDSEYAGIYCENFYLRGGWVWVTADYHGIDFKSNFAVSSGAITIKSTNTSGDASYRAINSRVSSPTISISGNHMAGTKAEPDILTTTAYTSSDIDFVALGECIMVRGVILYKGCYLFNGDAQPYQNVGSHTEYAYLKDKNTLELKGYQYSGSTYGIASNTDLTIVVCGDENSIEAKGGFAAITVRGNLTIVDGTNYSDELTLKAVSGYAINVTEDYVHTDVRLNASSSNYYPVYVNGDFTFNSGNFDTTSTYTGTSYNYPALTVNGNATFTKGFLNATAAPNYGDAMVITGNANFNGATVTVTSPKGNGINVKKGYLGVHGSKLTVTAERNGIYLAVGRLNMSDGFLTVSSTNTTSDGTYAALKLAGTSSDYYNVASAMAQGASTASAQTVLEKIVPANISTYDYVMIGDYIMIAGKVVKSGQSYKGGAVVNGNSGASAAYYYNGTLTLDGFSYTGENVGICTYKALTIQLKYTNILNVSGSNVGIEAYDNLTISGAGSLRLETENKTGLRLAKSGSSLVLEAYQLTIVSGNTGIGSSYGKVIINSGTVNITAQYDGIAAGSSDGTVTLNGGSLNIESARYGVLASNISVYGGKLIAKTSGNSALSRIDALGEDMVIWGTNAQDGSGLKAISSPGSYKYIKIEKCDHMDVTTDNDHNCDYCGKEGITSHTVVDTGYDDTYHWDICNCGQKTTEKHIFVDGTCVCGKDIRGFTKQPMGGEVAYGQKLTVTWTINFNPAMLVVVHYHGEDMTFQDLATSATSAELAPLPEGDYYTIRALIDTDGLYIESDKIYVTERKGAAPVIRVPQSMTVNQGDILDLYCSATSPDGSQLSYLWYSTSTGKLEDIIAVNRGAETNDTLRVDTTYPGTYYYVCGVDTANGGSAYSSIITVIVLEKTTGIKVNSIGTINHTVSGNVVRVTHDLACKVGYLSGGTYVAIAPVANSDGSYSFTVPAGVTEVLLVVNGDVNGDGKVNTSDKSRLNAVLLNKTSLTAEAGFAADVNGDGKVNTSDKSRLNAVLLNKTTLTW